VEPRTPGLPRRQPRRADRQRGRGHGARTIQSLAANLGTHNDFTYNSSYSIGQTQSAWTNSADYGLQAGRLFLRNSTSVEMDRYRVGANTSLRQTRVTSTELGWRFAKNLSLGGRIGLERLDTRDPSATRDFGETKNEYQLSMRSRLRR